jgi:hypothetical protein
MNTAGYTRERRPAMSAGHLIRLFGFPGRWDPARGDLDELARCAASYFDVLGDDEAVGIAVDASEIAAALDQPLWVRRIAAGVARACESRAVDGFTDWEKALDWVEACEHADNERKLKQWQLK